MVLFIALIRVIWYNKVGCMSWAFTLPIKPPSKICNHFYYSSDLGGLFVVTL